VTTAWEQRIAEMDEEGKKANGASRTAPAGQEWPDGILAYSDAPVAFLGDFRSF
jgi:hypothetical protein